jgi:hypothetical protein
MEILVLVFKFHRNGKFRVYLELGFSENMKQQLKLQTQKSSRTERNICQTQMNKKIYFRPKLQCSFVELFMIQIYYATSVPHRVTNNSPSHISELDFHFGFSFKMFRRR